MKKLAYILIILVSLPCLSLKGREDSSIFIWGDLNITVQLHEDLQVVLAEVKNNISLKEGYYDPDFYVENNYINYTTQSSINTSYIKTYRLDHRAVSPKYNKREIRSFFFHIVDTKPPEVISSTPFKISYGEDEPNYLKGLVVVDNYTPKEDIEIKINKSNINYNKVGIYEVLYIISDCSGNITFHTEKVEIVDVIKPTIRKIKELIIEVGEDFILEKYFSIEDNYDDILDINYKIIGGTKTLGKKELKVTAKDSSGNVNIYKDIIKVVDTTSPTIILKENPTTINIGEEVDFLDLVYEVSDNFDEVSVDDLIVSNNVNFNEVGRYEVVYELTDSSNNKNITILEVLIRDLVPPSIFADDIEVAKGEYKDFLMYVKATDNISKEEDIVIKITYNDVDFNKPGIYSVTFQAIDEYGNHSSKDINVRVLGVKKEKKIFYLILGAGIIALGSFSILLVMKKRKNTY